jgi:hypothetical protein
MKSKKLTLILVCCLLVVGIAVTLGIPAQMQDTQIQGADAQAKQLDDLARNVLKLDFGKVPESGVARNMVGLRSDQLVFSRRVDSRTYFVQDNRYGVYNVSGVFQGSEGDLMKRSREILRQLGITEDEITRAAVLQEKYQTGKVDPKTRKVSPGKIQDGRRMADFSRNTEGVPVFSSRALIGLTRQSGIGLMELHWPVIPKEVVNRAKRFQAEIKRGWKAPSLKGARVESVEAGIIHSPAVGFVMDIYPAIRVIYASDDRSLGKRPVRYVDENGRSVSVPRQFEKVDLPLYTTRPRR